MKLARRLLTAAALLVGATTVSAQATRTWVSGVGDDANPCSRTAPCKTFAGAISKTAAGGVINTLDGGGFGAVTITKSITIESEGQVAGILSAGANGVIINAANTDRVVLRNLRINGAGNGLDGIRILNAAEVSIEDSVIENMTQNAVEVLNSSGTVLLSMRNCRLNNVASAVAPNNDAIRLAPTGTGSVVATIDELQVRTRNNGLTLVGKTEAVVRDSVFTSGAGNGFTVANGVDVVGDLLVDSVLVQDFGGTALSASGNKVRIRATNSTLYGNGTAIAALNSGFVISFGNNRVVGHANASTFSATSTPQ